MERAKTRLESPVFFRMSFDENVKVNLLSYSLAQYEADKWYKIDMLLDWTENQAAFFFDGEFIANTKFFTKERD